MITINNVNRFNNTLEMSGLSSDILPTDYFEFNGVNYKIRNSSTILLMDTSVVKIFDEEHKKWEEL